MQEVFVLYGTVFFSCFGLLFAVMRKNRKLVLRNKSLSDSVPRVND